MAIIAAAVSQLVFASIAYSQAEASADDLINEARSAMIIGDYERAISLYSLVLSVPGEESAPYAREALEYLGLAHQKLGQVAHARAEYERYLELYPDSEEAVRVEQRLAALETARKAPPLKLTNPYTRSQRNFDVHGSLFTAYMRAESFSDLSGAELVDSSQIADGDVIARYRRGAFELSGRAAGYFRYDYDAGAVEVPARVTRLSIGAREQRLQLGGLVGRQSSRGGGVLGRFDGLTLDWTFMDSWILKAVAGFPLRSTVSNAIDTSDQVYSLSLTSLDLVKDVDAELYTVVQMVDGTTDRIASGLELRYASQRGYAYGLLDVDFHFLDLNIASFSGNLNVGRRTTLNAMFDYRYSPVLTTRNALIGQGVESIEALKEIYDDAEIEELARDRTLRVTTLVAGATHRLTPSMDLSGDFTATKLGGSRESGGVIAVQSGSWELLYGAQLVLWDWLTEGGSERFGVRLTDGQLFNRYAIRLGGQYRLVKNLRLRPELQFRYRDNVETQNYIELEPALALDYGIGPLVFDVEFILQWMQAVGSGIQPARVDGLGYFMQVGLRFDF